MFPNFSVPNSGDLPSFDEFIIVDHQPPYSAGFVPPLLLLAAGWLAEGYLKGLGTDIYNRLHGNDIGTAIHQVIAENAKAIKEALAEQELRQAVTRIRDLETLIISYNNAKNTSLDRLEHATSLSNSIVSELEQMGTKAFSAFTVAVQLQLSVLQERHKRFGEPGELANQEVSIGRWHKRAGEELGKADELSKVNPFALFAIPSFRKDDGSWSTGLYTVISQFIPRSDHICYKDSFDKDKKAAKARDLILEGHRAAFYEAYFRLLLGDIHRRLADMAMASLRLYSLRHQ